MHHGCMYAVYVEDPVVGPVSDRDTLTQSPAPTLECLHAFALRSSCPWTGQLGPSPPAGVSCCAAYGPTLSRTRHYCTVVTDAHQVIST